MTPLRDTQCRALIKLLGDDDPHMRDLLEEQFLGMGTEATDLLAMVIEDGDVAARRAARQILASLKERRCRQEFETFCLDCADDCDLETGSLLLARTRYVDIDLEQYRARLDQMSHELKKRLTGKETPRSAVEVCNRYFFQLLEFHGNTKDYYDPDNSYINRVLDRRLGIPISLSMVYLFVGWRLGLPLRGVNFPGHFIIKWHSPSAELFIDPFNRGQLLGVDDCRRLSERLSGGFRSSILEATSARQILLRTCANLRHIYSQNDPDRAEILARFTSLLAHD